LCLKGGTYTLREKVGKKVINEVRTILELELKTTGEVQEEEGEEVSLRSFLEKLVKNLE